MANENLQEEGVYLSPKTGNIIATGVLSASGIDIPDPNDAMFGGKSLPQIVVQYSPPADMTEYYKKTETSSDVQLNTKFSVIDAFKSTIESFKSTVESWMTREEQKDVILSTAIDNKMTFRDWN